MNQLHPKYAVPCTYVITLCDQVTDRCGATPTRRFVSGWYCRRCAQRWAAVVESWSTPRNVKPTDTAKPA